MAACTLDDAAHWCLWACRDISPKTLVTLNPEIIIRAERDPRLQEAIHSAALCVADGVGLLWAARREGSRLPARVPGVDLVTRILELGADKLPVYFLGGRPGVAERAAEAAANRFGTRVAGCHHGYFEQPGQSREVAAQVRASEAQLLLAGLGESQERFLHEQRQILRIPLMIGVGGTLEVLAGTAKRTPAWTRRAGLEWAWRVGTDPKRWHRFPRLLAFVRLVRHRASS